MFRKESPDCQLVQYLSSNGIYPHLERLFGSLRKNRKTLGLANSSYRNSVEVVLSTLGIIDCFSCIATKRSTSRVKAFSDIFLYATRELNTLPRNCLVLEDVTLELIKEL